jgi:hypothetical protein
MLGLKEGQLLPCFHPLRDDAQLEALTHGDDCADNCCILALVVTSPTNDWSIFSVLMGNRLRLGEARKARTEVVEREPYSHSAQSLQRDRSSVRSAYQNGLGQLELEMVRLQSGVSISIAQTRSKKPLQRNSTAEMLTAI